jgi:hypothetical protein
MKTLARGYVVFLYPAETEAMHLGSLTDSEWRKIGKAFDKGLVIALHIKGRYNIWHQLSNPHAPFNKLFEDPWAHLDSLGAWQKAITKVLLKEKHEETNRTTRRT